MNKQSDLYSKLKELYEIEPFSLALHTTNLEEAKAICEEGLKTGVRVLEGTLKFRGDLKETSEKDLDFFFPYTNHTIIVTIPKKFDAPRISDNQGGYTSLCEFSRFFEKAQSVVPHYSQAFCGMLPNYYILGYYDKDYNFVVNNKNLIFDKDSKQQFEEDYKAVENYKQLFKDF